MKFLLDTNICIYALKRRPPEVLARLRSIHPEDLGISVVTVLELRQGAEKSQVSERTHARLDAFMAPLRIVPFEEKDAWEGAKIRARLQRLGTPIGDYDCLIAASARARDLVLVSNNLREFDRVDGLRTENWVV